MKTKNLIVMIAVGIATSLSCFAQGGGSVNGPDLKGNMIPVYSDGEIPAEKLNSALTVCYKRMGTQVLETILGRPVLLEKNTHRADNQVSEVENPQSYEKNPANTNEMAATISYSTDDSLSPSIKIKPTDTIRVKPVSNTDKYYYNFRFYQSNFLGFRWGDEQSSLEYKDKLTITYDFMNSNGTDTLNLHFYALSFPRVVYELKDKSIYGELGELLEKHMFVSNIHFLYNPKVPGTSFQLMAKRPNGESAPTPITIDSRDLIQCIQTNLAK